jgi:hypothetical protein
MTALRQPQRWILQKMNEIEVAEMIERHIDYIDEDGRSVHLPMPFVRHFMRRQDSLPKMVSIAVLPVVLADGAILVGPGAPDPEDPGNVGGLDRLRGILFIVDKALWDGLPKREDCTEDAVRKAMQYLCDDWLCDVATDYTGKCTLIALALTMIERNLLDNRPAFFVTAGRRGGGKTTTLIMLLMAIMGTHPSAAAWSPNEEERRKAVMSYFDAGSTYILWDNIARGTQISCPHIERSCTAAFYSDRKLGVSEIICTAASTIHLFTGNNIGPKGDLASRSLRVHLEVDRPDPENREFKHPDPISWTVANRLEILQALYTILMGNPMLDMPRDAQCNTRFKMWWRVVGSAVEDAAELCAASYQQKNQKKGAPAEPAAPTVPTVIDFQKLFLDQEADEEDSSALAEMLDALRRQLVRSEFKASAVAAIVNGFGEESSAVRELLFPGLPHDKAVNAVSVGRRLAMHIDAPVVHGERVLTLKSYKDRDDTRHFYVTSNPVGGAAPDADGKSASPGKGSPAT